MHTSILLVVVGGVVVHGMFSGFCVLMYVQPLSPREDILVTQPEPGSMCASIVYQCGSLV